MTSKKVLIIGIDGVDPSLVEKLVNEGKVPNLAKFVREGAFGKLASTIPSLTPVAWTSMITGLNPGRHGISGFVRYLEGSYKLKILSSADRRGETLWQVLNRSGKKVGLLNYPALYPPEEIDGFMVGGMLTPSTNTEFTYPVTLREELLSKVPGYDIDINAVKHTGDRKALLEKLYELTEKRLAATKYLMKNKDWDLFFTVITETDRLGHFFWGYQNQEGSDFQEAIVDYFEFLDQVIGEIIAAAPPDTTVLVVSDHGMGEARRKFFVNEWLAREGLLRFKSSSFKFLFRAFFHNVVNLVAGILVRLGIDVEQLKKLLPAGVINKAIILYGYPEGIDWRRTKVWFAPGVGEGFLVNLAGSYPEGIVSEEEYEGLRDLLKQKLSGLIDSETGERAVKNVYKREEVYQGEATGQAADLLLEVADGYTTFSGRFGGRVFANVVEEDISGEHHYFGILGALGPGIQGQTVIRGAEIIDVAPTVLALLGVSGAEKMDGKVLKEMVEDCQ